MYLMPENYKNRKIPEMITPDDLPSLNILPVTILPVDEDEEAVRRQGILDSLDDPFKKKETSEEGIN